MKDKKYDRGIREDIDPIDEYRNYDVSEELNEDVKVYYEEDKESSTIFGIVTNCIKLNIRKAPQIDSEVTCTICSNTKVMIDLKESTDEWYKVYLAEGIDGFCMKNYISII